MKLEEGMYVRTINDKAVGNGIIGKIKYINEREFKGKSKKYYSVWTNNEDWFEILENNAVSEKIKASHNIIDLIEVGDYVNGFRVDEIGEYHSIKTDKVETYAKVNCSALLNCFYEEDIKSIVTREQFESMSYKIKE